MNGDIPPLIAYRLCALSVGVLSPSLLMMSWNGEWAAPGMMLSMWLLSPYLLLIVVSFAVHRKRALWLALVAVAATGPAAVSLVKASEQSTAALGIFALPILQAAFVLPTALFVGWAIDTASPDR
jgi:hypothetical protein